MANVSIRDLRNHGGAVVERARQGEHVVITSSGKPVAELRPLPQAALPLHVVLARRKTLPLLDAARLRDDIDAVINQRVF